jgi:hypothetical protein
MNEYASKVVKKLETDHGEQYIDNFLEETELWKILANWMSKIFNYLDRFFVVEKKLKKLLTASLDIYKSYVRIFIIILVFAQNKGEAVCYINRSHY